ncbi:MAG: HEAT repeat domain-containing protein [Acidimicrobiales bacterium]|nr:HEAT repeat domain-containing protein [Acidimicrobiales bacterium]
MTTDPAPRRRRTAAIAGHQGDLATLRALCADPDPAVRATALAGLQRSGALDDAVLQDALADADAGVRRRAAELAATHPLVSLLEVLADRDALVAEMAAWAAGERPGDPQLDAVTVQLVELAGRHRDPLVREAAVAALGSLEAPDGRAAVLAAMQDKPNVRRRAVLALVAYEGDEVDAALRQATEDRDWQVRTAAEELLRLSDAD